MSLHSAWVNMSTKKISLLIVAAVLFLSSDVLCAKERNNLEMVIAEEQSSAFWDSALMDSNVPIRGRPVLPYDVQSTIVDLIDEKDFTVLKNADLSSARPIYRKDLKDYVAYYEVAAGKIYYVFSSSSKTGDRRLVENGPFPRPTDLLNKRAIAHGEKCYRYYRLTATTGLFSCDNSNGTLVAATYDWVNDDPIEEDKVQGKDFWNALDSMLKRNLTDFQKEWQDLAKEVQASNQWKTVESADQGRNAGYAEESVYPGQVIKAALGQNLAGVQVSIHFQGTAGRKSKIPPEEWQERLCSVLPKVCAQGTTEVNRKLISQLANGIWILTFQVDDDRARVRRILNNTDVEFSINIKTPDGQVTRRHYGLDLKPSRKRRWSAWRDYSIPNEDKFPDYNQHKCCGCYSGCGPVAWAQIFAYYDSLAHVSSSYGYNTNLYRCNNGIQGSPSCTAPSYLSSSVQKYVEDIRKQVDTFCLSGGGATPHWDMTDGKLRNWYRSRQGYSASLSSSTSSWSSLPGIYRSWIRNNAINAVKSGYPAIVGIWSGKSQHYAVATKYRNRSRRYRYCWWFFGRRCGSWRTEYDHEWFLHMGWGGSSNGWRKSKAFAAFFARR